MDRRDQVLEAALAVFGRFGFRKASMDEVAKAAAISRPGLYLHFASKEALFKATMKRELDAALDEARAELAKTELDLPTRIIGAVDAYFGRYVGSSLAGDIGELLADSVAQLGTLFAERGAEFDALVAAALPARPDIEAADIAANLHATAIGWKHRVASRAEFVARMTVAVALCCDGATQTRS